MIMYIVAYDIADKKRLRLIANICIKYLTRVQKSVFEGDLSESQVSILQKELKKQIDKTTDSILIYFLRRSSIKKRIQLGKQIKDSFLII